MTKPKAANALAHPIEPGKWAEIREAERVSYGMAQPIRTNWKSAPTYAGAELQHRSAGTHRHTLAHCPRPASALEGRA